MQNDTVRTRRELADIFGLKEETRISRYVADGMPMESDGSYNVAACKAWRANNVRSKTKNDPKHNERLQRWKAAHEKEKAKTARIKRRQLEGKVLDIEDAYHLIKPCAIAIGEMANEMIEFLKHDPSDTPLTDAVLNVVTAFGIIQAVIGDKITNLHGPLTSSRLELIADQLGIELKE